MRLEVRRLTVPVAIGVALGLLCYLATGPLGFSPYSVRTWGAVALFASAPGAVMLMADNAITIREFVKQIAIWLAIVTLLPLTGWYGTRVVGSPPDERKHAKEEQKLERELQEAESKATRAENQEEKATGQAEKDRLLKKHQDLIAERDRLRQEKETFDQNYEAVQKAFYHLMFCVTYPIGLLAIVVGTFLRIQAVGSGLMFGGLFSLAEGCYSYWDRMDDWLRFGSLVLALVVVMVLGLWRFRPQRLETT